MSVRQIVDKLQEGIDAATRSLPRADYRSVLEELADLIEIRLAALEEDEVSGE